MYYCRKDKIYNADSTKYSECSFEITMNNSCIGKNGYILSLSRFHQIFDWAGRNNNVKPKTTEIL